MLIPNKHSGYAKDGIRVYPVSSDSPAPAPSSTSQTTTSIPEYARPYVEKMIGKAEALTDTPYQAYGGERQAGFTPLQQQAQTAAANMQPSATTAAATDMASKVGIAALNTKYDPATTGNQFQGTGQYNPQAASAIMASAPNLQNYQMGPAQQVAGSQAQAAQTNYNPALTNYQMGPAQQVTTQSFAAPGSADAYMSPYMQSVVGMQQREAGRQADIATTTRNAQATGAGAFGGSRQSIMDAEAARNLATQKGDIQATGSQAAFQQAQAQFNAEQQARLSAQQSNQQAGLTVGGQNLAANLGVQQLGTQTGLSTALANQQAQQGVNLQNAQLQQQAALANQQAGLSVGQANLQANLGVQQLGSGQQMQAQLANQQATAQQQQLAAQQQQFGANQAQTNAANTAQYGQAAAQLNAQQQQFGAGLGIQALQTAGTAAGQLGQLGAQDYTQQMGINQLQQQTGATQQAQQQQALTQQYQDFLTQKQAPYQQLSYTSDMLRGLPMSQSTNQMFTAPPSTTSTLAGFGTAALGASQLMRAKGGSIKEKKQRPAGLAELAISKMA